MSSQATPATRYRASYRPANTDTKEPAGILSIGPALLIQVESAEAKHRPMLDEVAEELNARAFFTIRVPPPPDAPRFGLYGEQVPRDAPGADAALMKLLADTYGLTLDPI